MVLTAERNIGAKLRSASRIEASRLPRLKQICIQWAESLTRSLAAEFETAGTVEYTGASSARLGTAQAPASVPALCLVAAAPGWPQPGLALADPRFCDMAAEFLLGGDGSAVRGELRAPTALDMRLARTLLDRLMLACNASFASVMEVALAPQRLHSETIHERLVEIFAEEPQDYILLRFRFAVGRGESFVDVGVPESVLALHRRKLDRLPAPETPAPDESWARDIEEGLQHADMHLVALLDEKAMTLGDIAGLAVGQTLVLNTKVDSLITVECEDQRLFRGRMGRGRESYLVRIEEKIDPTEEFIDDILSD